MAKKDSSCSFCGRSSNQVELMISGISGNICNHCVDQAQAISQSSNKPKASKSPVKKSSLKPVDIMRGLDEYVIGQDDAKKSAICGRL
jgi:ATP-dependent Clp protease ATP-binding subunit ClpX